MDGWRDRQYVYTTTNTMYVLHAEFNARNCSPYSLTLTCINVLNLTLRYATDWRVVAMYIYVYISGYSEWGWGGEGLTERLPLSDSHMGRILKSLKKSVTISRSTITISLYKDKYRSHNQTLKRHTHAHTYNKL